MLLKIKGSSIAEVIIALVIISLCYGIVSIVFTRMTRVTITGEDLIIQTEIMNNCWKEQLVGDAHEEIGLEYPVEISQHQSIEGLEQVNYKNSAGVILWNQERIIRK